MNYEMISIYDDINSILDEWFSKQFYPEYEGRQFYTPEELERFVHKMEIKSRKLAEGLPYTYSVKLCMCMYGEIVYGDLHILHEKNTLHLAAGEALRILQYGISQSRDEIPFDVETFALFLRTVDILIQAKTSTKMLQSNIAGSGMYFTFQNGSLIEDEKTGKFLDLCDKYLRGKGLRFRIASDTQKILNQDLTPENIIQMKGGSLSAFYLDKILHDHLSGKDIPYFAGTCYANLPAIDNQEASYQIFLASLSKRLRFMVVVAESMVINCQLDNNSRGDINLDMCNYANFPNLIQVAPWMRELIYRPVWKRWHSDDVIHGPMLSAIMPVDDYQVISSYSCFGDALNNWIEFSLYNIDPSEKWKECFIHALADNFEKSVVDFFRSQHFIAGNVEQDGKWNTQDGVVNLGIRFTGEVDTLAVDHVGKRIYFVECKRFKDGIVTDDNCYQRLKNNVKSVCGRKKGFAVKFYKKREEFLPLSVKQYHDYQLISVLVTDIGFPFYLPEQEVQEWEKDIVICDFDEFKTAVLENRSPRTQVEHV